MDLFDTIDIKDEVLDISNNKETSDSDIETLDDNYLNKNVDIKLNDNEPENLDDLITKIEDVSKQIEDNSSNEEISDSEEIKEDVSKTDEIPKENKFSLLAIWIKF